MEDGRGREGWLRCWRRYLGDYEVVTSHKRHEELGESEEAQIMYSGKVEKRRLKFKAQLGEISKLVNTKETLVLQSPSLNRISWALQTTTMQCP